MRKRRFVQKAHGRTPSSGGGVVRLRQLYQTMFAMNDTTTAIAHDKLYAGTVSEGILVFPLAGGNPTRIGEKQGLPANSVHKLPRERTVDQELSLLALFDILLSKIGRRHSLPIDFAEMVRTRTETGIDRSGIR